MAFSYLPQNDDELELKVGDIIEVVGEVSVPGRQVLVALNGLSEPTHGWLAFPWWMLKLKGTLDII